MPETVFGLPTHALVVHLMVVLLPSAALAGLAVALVPRWRRRIGVPVAGLAVLAALMVPVALTSGNNFYDHRSTRLEFDPGTEISLMDDHKDLANKLWPWPVTLAVGVLAVVIVPRLARRYGWARRMGTRIGVVASVIAVVGAGVTLVLSVLIGEAGARAVWDHR